jgi:hypothetical protein
VGASVAGGGARPGRRRRLVAARRASWTRAEARCQRAAQKAAVGGVNNSAHVPPPLVGRCRSVGSGARCCRAGGWWRRRAMRGVRHSSRVSRQRGKSEAAAQCPDVRLHEARCTFSSGQRPLCMPVRHSQSPPARPQRRCRRRRTATRVPRQLLRSAHGGRQMPADGTFAGAGALPCASTGALWQRPRRQGPRTHARSRCRRAWRQVEVTLREVLVSHVKSP